MTDVAEANTALQAWSIAGPLVGVIAGGVMAGVFNLWSAHRSHLYSRKRDLADLRRSEYFSAIDSAHRVRQSLERFGTAMSGRWQPDDDDESEEAQEMRDRDQESADSISALSEAIDGLRNTTLKLRAVGSEGVVSAIEALDGGVGDYFAASFEDGVFKAARYNQFFQSFEEGAATLLVSIRTDLEIDRVYTVKP